MSGPLAGVRVLDLGTRIAAPFCAGLLGEQGADVIKIEQPGTGDFMREIGPFVDGYSLFWAVEGRGRRSVTLDRPEERVAVDERTDLAHEVAGAGLFDLDDVGALLAEEPGAERGGDAGAQVEHPQALERAAHLDAGAAAGAGSRGRPSTRSPMIVRWISFVPAKIEAAW